MSERIWKITATLAAVLAASAMAATFGPASCAQEERGATAANLSAQPMRTGAPADVRESIERLRSSSPAERAAAACALGRMEARAAAAIPSLVELLSDDAPVAKSCGHEPPFEDEVWQPDYETVKETTVGEAATHALMAIGDASLDSLIETLTANPSWRARKNAAWALAHRGDDRAIKRMLEALLRDPSWQVRAEAAFALFQRGGADAETVKALIIAATQDEAWQVRQQAVFALGHKSDSTVDVVEPLMGVLRRDRDARVRAEAAGALWHSADAHAFPALLEALKDEDAGVRDKAADTLGNRAGNDEVPLLIAALKDEDARVRSGAKRALKIVKVRSQGRVTNLRPLPPGIPE